MSVIVFFIDFWFGIFALNLMNVDLIPINIISKQFFHALLSLSHSVTTGNNAQTVFVA